MKECLIVNKRRGKEEDKSGKSTKSENREQVSTKVTVGNGDHVGDGFNIGGGNKVHDFDHGDLGGFPGDECWGRHCIIYHRIEQERKRHLVS
jgi:hypothetical protein